MDQREMNLMIILKARGLTNQAIAEETGLSTNAIKMYFNRCKNPTARCEQCGKPIKMNRKSRRFCSDACRMGWWAKNTDQLRGHKYRCQQCGKHFSAWKQGKYCSRACYYASRRSA